MIRLVTISPENYEFASSLSVCEDQQNFIATIQKSLADAYVYKDAEFRLALNMDTIVGYVLIFPYISDGKQFVNIVRLMIDCQHQRQGLGRSLLQECLHWIQEAYPSVSTIRISTSLDNEAAIALYENIGFVEKGIEKDEITFYLGRVIN